MPLRLRSRPGGFTLFEILVTMLILAVLMTIALPLFLSATEDSETKTCRTNMHTIAGAVQAKRVREVAPDYSASISGGPSSLGADLGTVLCPTHGTYTISPGTSGDSQTFKVECSYGSHGSYSP